MDLYSAKIIRDLLDEFLSFEGASDASVSNLDELFDFYEKLSSVVEKYLVTTKVSQEENLYDAFTLMKVIKNKIKLLKALILDKVVEGDLPEAERICQVLLLQEVQLNKVSSLLLDAMLKENITPGVGQE
jgi:hypothetical protein